MADSNDPARPDLSRGVTAGSLADGRMLLGQVGDEEVILARAGDRFFAVGGYCTHYHGSLVNGLVVGETLRCPLHHACFGLRTGEAVRAPAFDPIACWQVEHEGDQVFVRTKVTAPASSIVH